MNNNKELEEKLIKVLKVYEDGDEEFIANILLMANRDYERKIMLDNILSNDNITYEDIVLMSLELRRNRKK